MLKKKTEEKKKEKEEIKPKKLSEAEFEKKVLDLAKQGFTSEKIGEKLRKEGVHSKEFSRKISAILKEKDLYANPDMKNVEEKLENLRKHFAKNKQDKRAMREVTRIHSQLRSLKKYHKVI